MTLKYQALDATGKQVLSGLPIGSQLITTATGELNVSSASLFIIACDDVDLNYTVTGADGLPFKVLITRISHTAGYNRLTIQNSPIVNYLLEVNNRYIFEFMKVSDTSISLVSQTRTSFKNILTSGSAAVFASTDRDLYFQTQPLIDSSGKRPQFLLDEKLVDMDAELSVSDVRGFVEVSGYIFLFGGFTSCQGVPLNGIAKLRSWDLQVDTTFNIGSGFSAPVTGVIYNIWDKKLYCVGAGSYNGFNVGNIACIDPDTGDLSTEFHHTSGGVNSGAISLVAFNKMYPWVYFYGSSVTAFRGQPVSNLFCLTSKGNVQKGFASLANSLSSMAFSPNVNNSLVVGGHGSSFCGLHLNGNFGPINPYTGDARPLTGTATYFGGVAAFLEDSVVTVLDGDFLYYYTGSSLNTGLGINLGAFKLLKYHLPSKTFSDAFPCPSSSGNANNFNSSVTYMFLNSDKTALYVLGNFSQFRGATANRIVKISTSTGAVLSVFGTGINNTITAAGMNGSLLYIAGSMTNFAGTSVSRLFVIDTETDAIVPFSTTDVPTSSVNYITFGNNSVYLIGNFLSPQRHIVKLSSSGIRDTSFVTGGTAFSFASSIRAVTVWYNSVEDKHYLVFIFTRASDARYQGINSTSPILMVDADNGDRAPAQITRSVGDTGQLIGSNYYVFQGDTVWYYCPSPNADVDPYIEATSRIVAYDLVTKKLDRSKCVPGILPRCSNIIVSGNVIRFMSYDLFEYDFDTGSYVYNPISHKTFANSAKASISDTHSYLLPQEPFMGRSIIKVENRLLNYVISTFNPPEITKESYKAIKTILLNGKLYVYNVTSCGGVQGSVHILDPVTGEQDPFSFPISYTQDNNVYVVYPEPFRDDGTYVYLYLKFLDLDATYAFSGMTVPFTAMSNVLKVKLSDGSVEGPKRELIKITTLPAQNLHETSFTITGLGNSYEVIYSVDWAAISAFPPYGFTIVDLESYFTAEDVATATVFALQNSYLGPYQFNVLSARSASQTAITEVTPLPPSGLDGNYFVISSLDEDYYIWYNVDSNSVDPAVPDRVGIEVSVSSSGDITSLIEETVFQINAVTSGLWASYHYAKRVSFLNFESVDEDLGGKYFLYTDSVGDEYYVWYNVDSNSVDPAVPDRIGIEVYIPSWATVDPGDVRQWTINPISFYGFDFYYNSDASMKMTFPPPLKAKDLNGKYFVLGLYYKTLFAYVVDGDEPVGGFPGAIYDDTYYIYIDSTDEPYTIASKTLNTLSWYSVILEATVDDTYYFYSPYSEKLFIEGTLPIPISNIKYNSFGTILVFEGSSDWGDFELLAGTSGLLVEEVQQPEPPSTIIIQSIDEGSVAAPGAGDSGFIVDVIREGLGADTFFIEYTDPGEIEDIEEYLHYYEYSPTGFDIEVVQQGQGFDFHLDMQNSETPIVTSNRILFSNLWGLSSSTYGARYAHLVDFEGNESGGASTTQGHYQYLSSTNKFYSLNGTGTALTLTRWNSDNLTPESYSTPTYTRSLNVSAGSVQLYAYGSFLYVVGSFTSGSLKNFVRVTASTGQQTSSFGNTDVMIADDPVFSSNFFLFNNTACINGVMGGISRISTAGRVEGAATADLATNTPFLPYKHYRQSGGSQFLVKELLIGSEAIYTTTLSQSRYKEGAADRLIHKIAFNSELDEGFTAPAAVNLVRSMSLLGNDYLVIATGSGVRERFFNFLSPTTGESLFSRGTSLTSSTSPNRILSFIAVSQLVYFYAGDSLMVQSGVVSPTIIKIRDNQIDNEFTSRLGITTTTNNALARSELGFIFYFHPSVGIKKYTESGGSVDFPEIVFAGNVLSMSCSGEWLYLLGNFTEVNGIVTKHLCRINILTGALDTNALFPNTSNGAFNLTPDANWRVHAEGDFLYAGGSYSSFKGVTCRNITKIDFSSGGVIASGFNSPFWDGSKFIYALEVIGDDLFIGGFFSTGSPSNTLVRVDKNTGAYISPMYGFLQSTEVRSIKPAGPNKIIVAGNFSSYSGTPVGSYCIINYLTGELDTSKNYLGANIRIYFASINERNVVQVLGPSFAGILRFFGGAGYAVRDFSE
jgi:hypothetical protein